MGADAEFRRTLRPAALADAKANDGSSEYTDEIMRFMLEAESSVLPSPHYMDYQPELTWALRRTLVTWLIAVHAELGLQPETLHLAVNLLDRACSATATPSTPTPTPFAPTAPAAAHSAAPVTLADRKALLPVTGGPRAHRLLALTCLWIAAKYEENNGRVPPLRVLARLLLRGDPTPAAVEQNAATAAAAADFVAAEAAVLRACGFAVGHRPTAVALLAAAAATAKPCPEERAGDHGRFARVVASLAVDTTLLHRRFLSCRPSHVATACATIAAAIVGGSGSFRCNRGPGDQALPTSHCCYSCRGALGPLSPPSLHPSPRLLPRSHAARCADDVDDRDHDGDDGDTYETGGKAAAAAPAVAAIVAALEDCLAHVPPSLADKYASLSALSPSSSASLSVDGDGGARWDAAARVREWVVSRRRACSGQHHHHRDSRHDRHRRSPASPSPLLRDEDEDTAAARTAGGMLTPPKDGHDGPRRGAVPPPPAPQPAPPPPPPPRQQPPLLYGSYAPPRFLPPAHPHVFPLLSGAPYLPLDVPRVALPPPQPPPPFHNNNHHNNNHHYYSHSHRRHHNLLLPDPQDALAVCHRPAANNHHHHHTRTRVGSRSGDGAGAGGATLPTPAHPVAPVPSAMAASRAYWSGR
ncbi:hypothetical protein DFJ73DRAFT_906054 [Zopfochytrium polystomum]|nr:hypothetical protein DFJ73DRAFT_906054 [Zopfochytrium polystomum]